MANKSDGTDNGINAGTGDALSPSSFDRMLLEATQRGDESLETGRYIVTYREDVGEGSGEHLKTLGLRVADARDFDGQAVSPEDVGDADALFFPEIGAAVISAPAAQERSFGIAFAQDNDPTIEAIEPEYFVFADVRDDYLRGFKKAIDAISSDLDVLDPEGMDDEDIDAQVSGATWGMNACRIPLSTRSGAEFRLAVLDTGRRRRTPIPLAVRSSVRRLSANPSRICTGMGRIASACWADRARRSGPPPAMERPIRPTSSSARCSATAGRVQPPACWRE